MNRRNLLISLIVLTSILLIGSILLDVLRKDDAYTYFTGIGDDFDISPDDQQILFPYFVNGSEAIYEAKVNGKGINKLTGSNTDRNHHPKYSPDGTKILYLSQNSKGISTLHIINRDGSNQKQLTPNSLQVSDAIFSSNGDTIYYISIPAKDFKKAEGETKEGYDLFAIKTNGKGQNQLTNENNFSMNSLTVSPDGKTLFYSLFDSSEKLTSYSLETGEENRVTAKNLPKEGYHFLLSPDGNKWAYTAVSKESKNSSLYKYELYLLNKNSGQTKRMTDLNASVISPIFFHQQNQIGFLLQTNWPSEPSKNQLFVQDLDTKKLHSISFDMPNHSTGNWFIAILNLLANGTAIALLYLLLVCLFATYQFFYRSNKFYLPAIVSLYLTVALLITSIVLGLVLNPWYGIGLGMVVIVLFICTIVVFVYTFFLNRFGKKRLT